jgi:hypothetical protein
VWFVKWSTHAWQNAVQSCAGLSPLAAVIERRIWQGQARVRRLRGDDLVVLGILGNVCLRRGGLRKVLQFVRCTLLTFTSYYYVHRFLSFWKSMAPDFLPNITSILLRCKLS